jgi:hypothetical protein
LQGQHVLDRVLKEGFAVSEGQEQLGGLAHANASPGGKHYHGDMVVLEDG